PDSNRFGLAVLLPHQPIIAADVDLLEAERLEELYAGLIALHDVCFDQSEVLLLQVLHEIGEQKLGNALAAGGFVYHQIQDADSRDSPAPAESFHFPDLGPGDQTAADTLLQTKFHGIDYAHGAFFPPRHDAGTWRRLECV